MIASIACFLSLLATPEVPFEPGSEVVLDGRVEAEEWADAFHFSRDYPDGKKVHLRLKRNGPWLALALNADRAYAGEVLRWKVAGGAGSWITDLLFGIGQPAMPPLLWRRGAPEALRRLKPGAVSECPRACRARVQVTAEDSWSAEYLVRLSALGIGHGDAREFRTMFFMRSQLPEPRDVFLFPEGLEDPFEPAGFARVVSRDGWGAEEHWAPVTAEDSRTFDDHELLSRLHREHEDRARRDASGTRVISTAVQPRSLARIGILRADIEAGRERNPSLSAWTHYLGRLLHEANMYAEARAIVESVPDSLRSLDPFVNLAAEHYLDTGEWKTALEICAANKRVVGMHETLRLVLAARSGYSAEQEFQARDKAKPEKNPRLRMVTDKGEIVVELFEDDAPHAVRNFMDLVLRRQYYDRLSFHDVVGGAFARIGDPRTRPGSSVKMDGPPWRLKADRSPRSALRGYLATIPLEGNAHHGSQFVITVAPLLRDRDKIVVFGRILEGREVAESLEQDDRMQRVEVIRKRNHAYDALSARIDQ